MKLLSVSIRDFRNLAQVELGLSAHATVLVGQNGQGKTNFLEAVYFLATLKPLRAQKLSELVAFGKPAARVSGRFLLKGSNREISVEVSEGKRQAAVDGKKTQDLEDYFGGVSVVAFTPEDLEVVKGSPETRRAFLDRATFNRFPAYLKESRTYARALKNRNRLLKDRAEPTHLAAFDEALSRAGARLWVRRRALMTELSPQASASFDAIGRAAGAAAYGYRPAKLPDLRFPEASEEALEQALAQALDARRGRDLERGFTSVGPHVDDVEIVLGGQLAKGFASQGQQRALVLAWKVAEIENLRDAVGFLPLLLLDDVSSELDAERNGYLMEYLAQSRAQVVMTTTDPALVAAAASEDTRWIRVSSGALEERPAPSQD